MKKVAQTGIAGIALTAWETVKGTLVLSVGPVSGTSYHILWMLLGFSWRVMDMPEKAPRFCWWPRGHVAYHTWILCPSPGNHTQSTRNDTPSPATYPAMMPTKKQRQRR